MNTQSTQRFVSDAASRRFAPQQLAPRRNASLRDALQRNDLLVTTSPQLCTPCRITPHLDAFHRNSTQRFVSDVALQLRTLLRAVSLRNSAQLNDLLVTPHRSAPRQYAAQLPSTQLNDLLVTTPRGSLPRNFALRNATLCAATQLNSTQRFVSDNDIASPLSATRRSAVHCIATLLNSTLSLNKGVQSCISDPLLH